MNILNGYLLVEKLPKKESEGFEVVETQDDFVYKGRVINCAEDIAWHVFKIGDVITFAKYSPDTHEIDLDGRKVKFVKASDVLAVE